ncbi:nucleotide pyrophosphohydrolase [Candidatus Woesearchaeota archaeon]|nr:nucleotide pyrophosphohydrolase [Candidatus Woesearchaeota archaeon]
MKEIDELIQILSELRAGCPRDKLRDEKNLIKHLRQEIQEIELAIENKDLDNLKEELGDSFFTMLFLLVVAEDNNDLSLKEVLTRTKNKMVYRHPHVFESPREVTPEEADEIWAERKKLEKQNNVIH